jgi:hypothetical protein
MAEFENVTIAMGTTVDTPPIDMQAPSSHEMTPVVLKCAVGTRLSQAPQGRNSMEHHRTGCPPKIERDPSPIPME